MTASAGFRPRVAPRPADGFADRRHRLSAGEWTIVMLEFFVAVNAMVAGAVMLANPQTPLGMTPDLIAASPFTTYTWPGVLLMVLNGLVPAALAVGVVAGLRLPLALSAAWGVGLVGWIVTQWVLLTDLLWLQFVLVVLGGLVAWLSLRAWRQRSP